MANGLINKPQIKTLKYIDCSISSNNGGQINSLSGGVVNNTNFISCYVIGTNDLTPVVYTYSNLVYARLKNYNTMANADSGNYTLRVWYYS